MTIGMAAEESTGIDIALGEVGERLSGLRLCEGGALDAMRRSLARHGQMTSVVGHVDGEHVEVIDGFKRLRAARALGWASLRMQLVVIDTVGAKLMIAGLHEGRGLTELEEGWLVRSLYREDRLGQAAIAQRLGRHKSWVCRRLMLVEALDAAVQADVRLGLLPPRAAVALGRLPRGNQHAAAGLVVRRGFTVKQSELLVTELLECDDDAAREARVARYLDGPGPTARPGVRPTRAARAEADWLATDVATVVRVAARLQARLVAAPVAVHGAEAAELIVAGLRGLHPVLVALVRTIDAVTTSGRAVA